MERARGPIAPQMVPQHRYADPCSVSSSRLISFEPPLTSAAERVEQRATISSTVPLKTSIQPGVFLSRDLASTSMQMIAECTRPRGRVAATSITSFEYFLTTSRNREHRSRYKALCLNDMHHDQRKYSAYILCNGFLPRCFSQWI
jgi:hypothetical protein